MRILVVEDSDSIRSMIQTLVSARGHEVEAVSSGTKGVDAALTRTPDAVLLDLHMPGTFDGFEVCRRLRASKLTHAVPIIVISALADETSRTRAMDVGATAYYTKPFSPTAILKELEKFSSSPHSKPPSKSPQSK